uniref:Uncharacterized protein n=1 Tax=Sphaerodactylus townsendi TaxID=933632 RepID=A0ACB8GBC5_9SAUR
MLSLLFSSSQAKMCLQFCALLHCPASKSHLELEGQDRAPPPQPPYSTCQKQPPLKPEFKIDMELVRCQNWITVSTPLMGLSRNSNTVTKA